MSIFLNSLIEMPVYANKSGLSSGLISGEISDYRAKTLVFSFIYSVNIVTTYYRSGPGECTQPPLYGSLQSCGRDTYHLLS